MVMVVVVTVVTVVELKVVMVEVMVVEVVVTVVVVAVVMRKLRSRGQAKGPLEDLRWSPGIGTRWAFPEPVAPPSPPSAVRRPELQGSSAALPLSGLPFPPVKAPPSLWHVQEIKSATGVNPFRGFPTGDTAHRPPREPPLRPLPSSPSSWLLLLQPLTASGPLLSPFSPRHNHTPIPAWVTAFLREPAAGAPPLGSPRPPCSLRQQSRILTVPRSVSPLASQQSAGPRRAEATLARYLGTCILTQKDPSLSKPICSPVALRPRGFSGDTDVPTRPFRFGAHVPTAASHAGTRLGGLRAHAPTPAHLPAGHARARVAHIYTENSGTRPVRAAGGLGLRRGTSPVPPRDASHGSGGGRTAGAASRPGQPKMGPDAGRHRGDGRGGEGRLRARRARPLSAVGGSAPRSLRPPSPQPRARRLGLEPRASPGGGLRAPQTRSGRRVRARRAGQGARAPGEAAGPRSLSRPCPGPALPGPAVVPAGAEPPRYLPDPAAADRARRRPSPGISGRACRGGSERPWESITHAPIFRTRQPTPGEGQEPGGKETDLEAEQLGGAPSPARGSGGGRHDGEGDEIASSPPPRGTAAGTSALLGDQRRQTPRSRPPPAGDPRSRAPPWRIPAGLGARRATSLKAAPGNQERAEKEAPGRARGPRRSGIPERAHRPPPGSRRGRRERQLTPRPPRSTPPPKAATLPSSRPLLRRLDLARVLKAGPAGTPASGHRVWRPPAIGEGAAPPSNLPHGLFGCGVSREMEGMWVLGDGMAASPDPSPPIAPPGYEKGSPLPCLPAAPAWPLLFPAAALAPRGRVFVSMAEGTKGLRGSRGWGGSVDPSGSCGAGVRVVHPHACTPFNSSGVAAKESAPDPAERAVLGAARGGGRGSGAARPGLGTQAQSHRLGGAPSPRPPRSAKIPSFVAPSRGPRPARSSPGGLGDHGERMLGRAQSPQPPPGGGGGRAHSSRQLRGSERTADTEAGRPLPAGDVDRAVPGAGRSFSPGERRAAPKFGAAYRPGPADRMEKEDEEGRSPAVVC
ncbi:collagen alpha-1(III) chain-like [Choloepus didactylus]|uniref:collagen alpha-1(III) chain-like n=1 Tax=Choloepus didactylus TaxID=27675 RepID=UPI00189F9367|nr:collagen alpha-1(III) chain-like [Choloepus didactylus]